MEFRPNSTKNFANFCINTRKGVDRCVYHIEALQCLRTINANDPRPKRAVAHGHTTKNRPRRRYSKLKYTAKRHTCVSVRLVLVLVKFADFNVRTRAKLFYSLKITYKFRKKPNSAQIFNKNGVISIIRLFLIAFQDYPMAISIATITSKLSIFH